jgi:hypothetical protein
MRKYDKNHELWDSYNDEIGSTTIFFMDFEGKSSTVVNCCITSKWMADEFPKRALVNHWEVGKRYFSSTI